MGKATDAIQLDYLPELRNPVMFAAFEGWNDGGASASGALEYMIKAFGAQRFASIDPEEFYVFSENRPTVSFTESGARSVTWQRNAFYHARLPGTAQDAVLFTGVEPNLRWRTFCEVFTELARQLGVQTLVTLGAFLADVLYTLPVQLSSLSNDPELEARAGLRRTNYEGPTGIVGVLTRHCEEKQMRTLSLWAGVPYYISIPNPKATFAQLQKLRELFGFTIDLTKLEAQADNFDNEINDIVAKNPNVAAYVRELKKREFLN